MSDTVRIALDGMGGDQAPQAALSGAKHALARDPDLEIVFVGTDEARKALYPFPKRIRFVRTNEVIGMDEQPIEAYKGKRRSSIALALRCVKQGHAHAFFSAGNTGAAVVSSLFILGRKKGILRPAIATILPLQEGVILIDSGANAECKAEHYLQFAEMGTALSQRWLGRKSPTIGLLNIGSEEGKGGSNIKKAYRLLSQTKLNFIGNIEPDVMFHLAEEGNTPDILVCDGQTGNLLLKFAEGLTQFLFHLLRKEIESSFKTKLAGLVLKPSFLSMAKRLGYESQSCAPLLGLNGIVTIGHGKSNAFAFCNALLQTAKLVRKE